MKKTLYLVYVDKCVKSDEFNYLHRFLHPGILANDGNAAFLCKDIETSSPYFALTLIAPDDLKGRKVQIQHSLIVAILELVTLESQLGFLNPAVPHAKST